jgi:hypothetical protein
VHCQKSRVAYEHWLRYRAYARIERRLQRDFWTDAGRIADADRDFMHTKFQVG